MSIFNFHFRKLLWVYCPEHTGVRGNGRADKLAGKASITWGGLRLGRSEVLRSLRHYPRAKCQGHDSTDHLEERDVERDRVRRPSLKGWKTAIVKQTNNGTVSKATLGNLWERETGWSACCCFLKSGVCFCRSSSLAAGQPTPRTDRQRHLSLHPVLGIAMGHEDCATLPGLWVPTPYTYTQRISDRLLHSTRFAWWILIHVDRGLLPKGITLGTWPVFTLARFQTREKTFLLVATAFGKMCFPPSELC